MFELDQASAVPPFEQIRVGLAERITSGALPVGTKLPTVRQLAIDLGVAVNTVARAYRELESAGLVETHGRNGTFVNAPDATQQRAHTAAQAYAEVARASGLDVDEAVALVRTAYRR